MQWGHSKLRLGIDECSMVEQNIGDIFMTTLAGKVQGGLTVLFGKDAVILCLSKKVSNLIEDIHTSIVLNENLDDVQMSFVASEQQW